MGGKGGKKRAQSEDGSQPMENTGPQKPLFGSTRLGRILTKRNIVIFAFVLIVFDIALTRYFFTSRHKALFLSDTIVAAREREGPVALGELTKFEWKNVTVTPRADGGRFWFSTYDSKTFIFDYVLDYDAGEIRPETSPGAVFTPDSKFVLERDATGVRMRPAP